MKNFEYKKSLGQNFLIDQNIINKIINLLENLKLTLWKIKSFHSQK